MSLVSYQCCPACMSDDIEKLEAYDAFPAILWPIEAEKRHTVSAARITAWMCNACHHVFLNDIDEDFARKLYEDYYYLYPFKNLESLQAPYREAFDGVANLFFKNKGTLLEIGCDDITQMKPFLDRGLLCSAINPGAKSSEHIHFIDGFYGSTTVPDSFDYVVSRFNLEHIVHLDTFFEALHKNLREDGLAIIQVPNIQLLAKAGMLNILAHEHPHYFCRQSLQALLSRRGYEILYLSRDDEASLICAFGRSSKGYEPKSLKSGASTMLEFAPFMQQHEGQKVFIYGVSMSLTGLLYSKAVDASAFSEVTVIDDNPLLHGKYMPLTDMKIVPVDKAGLQSESVVLLSLNPIYFPPVIERLKRLGVQKNIFAVSDRGFYRIQSAEVAT
ncbi:MAG: class I SAM-dependent methyltransferase [Pseudomonadota bacterium]